MDGITDQTWHLKELLTNEPIAKVFFCGSTSSPRTEKFNDFNLSPFTLSLSKGKLRTFAITSNNLVLVKVFTRC
jgi:hypothetical protein